MLNFPQELVDYVVDFVHDDLCTLATIRLVTHAWNISARAHLFRSLDLLISISPGPRATLHSSGGYFHVPKAKYRGLAKFEALLSLLETSPDISDCIREVSIGRTTSFSASDPGSHKQQDSHAALISSILCRFGHLSDVVFREMNWASLSPSFLSCILEICKTRTLERIEIWNCQMPTTTALFDFLEASRNVKSLRLSYFRILAVDIDAEDAKPPPSATAGEGRTIHRPYGTEPCTSLLHSLAIDAAPDAFVLQNILGMRPYSINFLNLRRLYLGNINDTAGVVEFLQKAGHSLELLDLRLTPCKQLQPRLCALHLALSHCPRLRHLRISGLHWTPAICPSEYLSSFFDTPPDQSLPIECVQLVVTVLKPKGIVGPNCGVTNDPESPSCRPTELRYSDWSILDTVLSSRIFRVLKTFQISIKAIREREVDPSRLSDMFPKLKDNGVQVICG